MRNTPLWIIVLGSILGCQKPVETPPLVAAKATTRAAVKQPETEAASELAKHVARLEEELKSLRSENAAQGKSLVELKGAFRQLTAPPQAAESAKVKERKQESSDHDAALIRFASLSVEERMELVSGNHAVNGVPPLALQLASPSMRKRIEPAYRRICEEYAEGFGWDTEEQSGERDNALAALAEMGGMRVRTLRIALEGALRGDREFTTLYTDRVVRAMQFASPKVRARALEHLRRGIGAEFDRAFGWENAENAKLEAEKKAKAAAEDKEKTRKWELAQEKMRAEQAELAAKRALDEDKAKTEADVKGKLRLAKKFLDANDHPVAKRRLKEVIKQYPDTDEAKEARTLLQKLEQDAEKRPKSE